jgi:hypothetical protein
VEQTTEDGENLKMLCDHKTSSTRIAIEAFCDQNEHIEMGPAPKHIAPVSFNDTSDCHQATECRH